MPNGRHLTNSEAKQTTMRKLTKKQIQEGLDLIPMDRLLLGTGHDIKLTTKQKNFAEELAKGNTKVGAYRKAYNTKAKPSIQATSASRLASQPHIQLLADRISTALEAQKYQTPAHIRALTIHELTVHAISEDTAPAQRIKALELLGKITEVALFTERRETIVTTDSTDARAKLMNAMRLAITNSQAIDAEYTSADDLMAELAGIHHIDDDELLAMNDTANNTADTDNAITPIYEGTANEETATPPTPDPVIIGSVAPSHLHSIPHNESLNESPINSQRNSAILEGVVSENTGFDQK
jgi:hypothetical protein